MMAFGRVSLIDGAKATMSKKSKKCKLLMNDATLLQRKGDIIETILP